MKRTPQNSQIPYVRRSGQVVLCAHRVASFPNKPITSGPSLGCSERDLEWVPPGGGYTLMASHFLSAALRASATSRQHPSPQGQTPFVTLFYRQEKGTKGSPARNVNSPAACFWRIISAALSLSRCISEPVLELPFFCRRRKVSRRLTGSTRSFARWGWRGYAGIPTHQQPSSQISTKRCFFGRPDILVGTRGARSSIRKGKEDGDPHTMAACFFKLASRALSL